MRCDNVDKGCTWTGTVGTLKNHVDKCQYTLVRCSYKCKDNGNDFSLVRKDLKNHLTTECPNRAHKCEYCGEEGTYASITEEHDQLCLKKQIPCPNTECKMSVERGRVEEHVANECVYTIVACQYSNIGCIKKEKRKNIKTHEEDDKVHLHLSLKKIAELDDAISSSNNKITSLMDEMSQLKSFLDDELNLKKKKCIKICVPGYSQKKIAKEIYHSAPFFTVPNGYVMNFRVDTNGYGVGEGTHVSVYTELLKLPHREDQLKWPFRGTVAFELLNQLADDKHKKYVVEYIDNSHARPGGGWGCHCFIPHSDLPHNPATKTQYLAADDTLYFRVTVQEKDDWPWLN